MPAKNDKLQYEFQEPAFLQALKCRSLNQQSQSDGKHFASKGLGPSNKRLLTDDDDPVYVADISSDKIVSKDDIAKLTKASSHRHGDVVKRSQIEEDMTSKDQSEGVQGSKRKQDIKFGARKSLKRQGKIIQESKDLHKASAPASKPSKLARKGPKLTFEDD